MVKLYSNITMVFGIKIIMGLFQPFLKQFLFIFLNILASS